MLRVRDAQQNLLTLFLYLHGDIQQFSVSGDDEELVAGVFLDFGGLAYWHYFDIAVLLYLVVLVRLVIVVFLYQDLDIQLVNISFASYLRY